MLRAVESPTDSGRTPLLIIDDDLKLCRLLTDYLEPLGYSVVAVHDGRDGLALAREGTFAAIVLDVMLPGANGFDVLRELRRSLDVPILMLTAVGSEADRIAGLEIGADDYMPKPFSPRELLARLRAVLRRARLASLHVQATAPSTLLSIGGLVIDPAARTVSVDRRHVTLTAVEFDLLVALARSPGWVKSREQLLLDVADRDFEAFDRSIDVHVSALRKKLGDDAREPRFIDTVRGAGYRLRRPGEAPA
jgi:DNA-binding response OmpR family regulator